MRLRPYVFYMSQGARMRSIPRGFRRRNHCVKILPARCGRPRVPGAYSVGVTPLPIPNRAVKPRSADGTALRGGRVGRCQDSFREALSSVGGRASLCFCLSRRGISIRPARNLQKNSEILKKIDPTRLYLGPFLWLYSDGPLGYTGL